MYGIVQGVQSEDRGRRVPGGGGWKRCGGIGSKEKSATAEIREHSRTLGQLANRRGERQIDFEVDSAVRKRV